MNVNNIIAIFSNVMECYIENQKFVVSDHSEAVQLCKKFKIKKIEIIVCANEQFYQRSLFPQLPLIDKQIYTYKKLYNFSLGARCKNLSTKKYLIIAGIRCSDKIMNLQNLLQTNQISVINIRLLALELQHLISHDQSQDIWNVFLIRHNQNVMISVLKHQELLYFSIFDFHDMQTHINALYHHPEYYSEEIKFYTTTNIENITNATYLSHCDIMKTIQRSKATFQLCGHQFMHLTKPLGFLLVALNFFMIAYGVYGLIDYTSQKDCYRSIQQTSLIQQKKLKKWQKTCHNVDPKIFFNNFSQHQLNNQMMQNMIYIQGMINKIASIESCKYKVQNDSLHIESMQVSLHKYLLDKQLQQLQIYLQKILKHKVLIQRIALNKLLIHSEM